MVFGVELVSVWVNLVSVCVNHLEPGANTAVFDLMAQEWGSPSKWYNDYEESQF